MKPNREKYKAAEALIRQYLRYEPTSGKFYWVKKPPHSRKTIGSEAGCSTASDRVIIKLGGHQLYAHWVAWWIMTGAWPVAEIDHENLRGADNRWSNLRAATRTQNSINRRPHRRKRGSLKGTYTDPSMNGRWAAQIVTNGKQIYLGRFDTEELAHAAYVQASKEFHGQFSRTA